MKTVSKFLVIINLILFVNCKRVDYYNINKDNIPNGDYFQSDSVYFKIDVVDDDKKELFLITNNYVVGDSIIGSVSNFENVKKAYQLVKSNQKYIKSYVFISSKIYYFGNKRYNQIANINSIDGVSNYIILKQGYSQKPIYLDKKIIENGFLRIQEVSDYYIGGRYINMIYFKNKWRIYSKEIDNPTKALIQYPKGYCIDSTVIDYDLNKNDFNEIFFLGDGFKCHTCN